MVSTDLIDRLHKLNRTDKLYVMQTLLNDFAEGEKIVSFATVESTAVGEASTLAEGRRSGEEPTIKQRIPNLRKGRGWVADDFDAPLPDDFWLGETT